jgi:virginiamycin A acetyltransferase
VVVSDVPAYTIVGGNPAKPLKQRFSADDIESLQSIAWWDWSVEKITLHLAIIMSGDIDALRTCGG